MQHKQLFDFSWMGVVKSNSLVNSSIAEVWKLQSSRMSGLILYASKDRCPSKHITKHIMGQKKHLLTEKVQNSVAPSFQTFHHVSSIA